MWSDRNCGVWKLLRIVVTLAVRQEFASWKRLWHFERTSRAPIPIYVARRGNAEICAAITGIGMRNQQAFADLLAEPVDICIASGLAGSLKRQHAGGEILVARAVHGIDDRAVASDDSLVNIAIRCGARGVDLFHTSTAVVRSSAEKLRLGANADAVDMESYPILAEACRRGIPAVAVRAISDPADVDMPLDFNQVIGKSGEIHWRPMWSEIAKAPKRLPHIMRFGFQSSRAARRLGQFMDRYVNCLIEESTSTKGSEILGESPQDSFPSKEQECAH